MKPIILSLLFALPILLCKAQLKADFTTSDGIKSGCSPFSVSYKNLTTGASSKAVYKWYLGNSNKSNLLNPGASYAIEKTYTVLLMVTDSGNTSTKTLNIVVYKKPVVDFTITNTKGCIPLTTTFVSKANAGDGFIVNSFWDFGDGTTISDPNSAIISHTFTSTQAPRIDLIVTNSYGCQNFLRKSTAIEIQPQPVVSFSVTNPFLCSMADSAFLKNNSTGAGILTYAWNFGDNTKSTTKDASHLYQEKGNYGVTLTVASNFGVGCINSLKKPEIISVANFKSDMIFLPLPVLIRQFLFKV